jgi:predicted nucleotidyltransferase
MKKITPQLVDEITKRIVEKSHPEKIILFGSYAWGNPETSSDLDLFIIVPYSENPSYRRSRPIYNCLRGIGVPIDIIVQTRDEVEQKKNVVTSLAHKVLEKGKVLYG